MTSDFTRSGELAATSTAMLAPVWKPTMFACS